MIGASRELYLTYLGACPLSSSWSGLHRKPPARIRSLLSIRPPGNGDYYLLTFAMSHRSCSNPLTKLELTMSEQTHQKQEMLNDV
jgi:hypothetical protein